MVSHLINILSGAGIGNKTNMTQKNVNAVIQKTKELYETGQINKSITELVKSTISKTLVANQTNVTNTLKSTNTIKIGNAHGMTSADKIELAKICGPTDYDLGEIWQGTEATLNSATETINKTKVDIKEEVEKSVKESMNSLATDDNTSNSGTAFGDIAKDVVGGLAAVGKEAMGVLKTAGGGAGIGNKFSQTNIDKNITDINNSLTKKNIDTRDFKDMEDMSLEDELSQDNITAIVNEVLAANDFVVDDPCIKSFKLDKISQFSKASMKIESKTLNEVSKSIATKYIKNIEFVMGKIEARSTSDNSGDIAALGGAVAGSLTAGGKAVAEGARGIGDGVSTGARGIGDGVSTGAQGIGDGLSKTFSSIGKAISTFIWPLAIVVVIAIIIGLIWKFGGFSAIGSLFSKSDSGDDDWEDEGDWDDEGDRKYLSYYML